MESTQQIYKAEEIRESVLAFARTCRYEQKHSQQVTKLALRLFDELQLLHNLGTEDKFLLEAGSLLHDIGWIRGREAHHKTSRDLILESKELTFSPEARVMVALIARYHRRALPEDDHKYYKDLDVKSKQKVCALASFLRIADALDRSHMNFIEDVACHIFPLQVVLELKTKVPSGGKVPSGDKGPLRSEIAVAKRKADLFEKVFKRLLVIE